MWDYVMMANLKGESGMVTYTAHETFIYKNSKEELSTLEVKGRDYVIQDSLQNYQWDLS